MSLEIDFETRSDVDLKKHGVYRYVAGKHFRPLIASYKLNDGATERWRWGQPCPPAIRVHIEAGGTIKAHNAGFERLVLKWLHENADWPEASLEQFVCTAATAAAMSLPRDLAGLGTALNLSVQKDKEGTRLIRKFCVPRRARKGEDPTLVYFNEPEDHPEGFEHFILYCDRDVETEAAADARMIPLSQSCQEAYYRSERINDRGIRIDVASASRALILADKAKALLDREMTLTTSGYVTACSQVSRLTQWVRDQGVTMESAAKAELEELLEYEDLPDTVRRAIELRQEAGKTSVAKLSAFLQRVGDDARIRGAFLFRAAGTGRYSSLGAQLHNLPRPRKEFGDAHLDLKTLFANIKHADPEWLKFLYGEKLGRTLWLLSDAIRGFIWAAPGHDLLVADYSGIEGAIAAWVAGEEWKLDALFELIKDPKLPDLYRRTAAGIYGTTTEKLPKSDGRRQVGKVAELSLGYQGGVGAFYSMSRGYGLKLKDVYAPVWEAADDERRERAEKRYEECLARNDVTTQRLCRESWIAAELVKVGWRATNPAIAASWPTLEEAMWDAVSTPGRAIEVDFGTGVTKVTYLVRKGFLWCRLPSGRCLAYGSPAIREVEVPWADKSEAPEKREKKLTVTALGVNSVTKKFERFALYGGLAFENIVQAIALDLLDNGIAKAEQHGYSVIGHVHDEIITEVPKGFGDVAEFEKLICELPAWAEGLPLTASGWRGKRYRKD